MMEVEKHSGNHTLPLIGHCTDSASNALNALVKLASPATYSKLKSPLNFLGLPMDNFVFAPVIHSSFPSIAYPCWDHSGRTSICNLMNENIKIVAKVLPPGPRSIDSTAKYSLATIQDLKLLKKRFPGTKIRHADITPRVRQNCDAAV